MRPIATSFLLFPPFHCIHMGLLATVSKEIHGEQHVREMNHLGAQDINSKDYIWFKKKNCRQYCRDMCKSMGIK